MTSSDVDEEDILKELPKVSSESKDTNRHEKESQTRSGGSFWFLIPVSGVFVSTFTMNFLAEWGDKSQLSVIVLAAKGNFVMVCAGALAGHLVANSLAVMGGSFIRDVISIRTGDPMF